eukprot:symbB.v1.2.025103.t3/scaffold2405.1/size80018/3
MEPSSGFYWDPVLVLDFKGMYPSLIVAHNLSFDTCLGHSRRTGLGPSSQMGVLSGPWQLGASANELAESFDGTEGELQDPAVRLAASGALFVGPQVRKGLLPLMLAEVLQLRAETKKLAKQSCASLAKRLEHKQFALKYFANVTYGYSSASFSGRMPCSELADSIVATGRRALEEAANFIEANWEGAKIVYGDTDSVFVQLKGYSLEEAFQTGRQICAEVSAKHPAPVELEFEKVYMPCLCLTKKRYGGLAYAKPPSEGGTGNFEAKGLEAIRRDQCRMASNVQNEILTDFFRTKDLSSVKRIFVAHATDILKGSPGSRHSVADLSFFREARLGTYRAEAEDGGGATLPPQAAVAVSRIAAEGDTVTWSSQSYTTWPEAMESSGCVPQDGNGVPKEEAFGSDNVQHVELRDWLESIHPTLKVYLPMLEDNYDTLRQILRLYVEGGKRLDPLFFEDNHIVNGEHQRLFSDWFATRSVHPTLAPRDGSQPEVVVAEDPWLNRDPWSAAVEMERSVEPEAEIREIERSERSPSKNWMGWKDWTEKDWNEWNDWKDWNGTAWTEKDWKDWNDWKWPLPNMGNGCLSLWLWVMWVQGLLIAVAYCVMKPHPSQPWEVRPQMLPLRTQHFVQASAPSVAVNQMYPRLVSGYAPAVPLQRPLAAPAPRMLRSGPQLPRMLRVGPVAVQVMEEPSMQSKRLPWVVQEPGQVVLTSGATHGEWVQLLFAHLRKGWAPLRSFLPEPRGGMHGDGMYDGLDRAICSHQSEMLEVILGELKPRQLSRADGQSFHLQKDGWQAYAWLPACQGPVPLIVVLHGSRPMDWDFLSQFAERWQKDAMEYQVAVIVPESIGPTWDYLLTCQRKDMDFIEYAINEVDVDDRSIAVMGMSDGASLALSMALRNPRVFTTALVQATGFFHDPLPMRLKPRVYMEYGQEDKLFEPDRVAYPNRDRLREDGCEVEFMMIPGAGHMVQEEFFHRALDFWLRGARPSTRRELCTAGSPTDCRLDRWWYVEKALLPCTARILHSDLAGLPPNLDVNSWLREVRRPSSSRARGPLDRLLRPSCRKCGEKAIFGDMCGACTGPAAKEQLQQKAQESRHAVEELQKTCVSCAGCLWKSCNAAEFCDVRTRRGEAENDMARLTALMEELQLEGPGKRSSSGPAVDDWKSPEALVFDVNSDSEDEPSGIKQEAKAATSGAVKQEKEEGEDDALCISSEEEQINATQLDEEEGEEGHATAAAPMETSEPSREPPPLCKHQEVCREVEVKKEGANKGRHFFVCPRGREEQCDFFAWADGTAGASRTFDKRHILGDSKRGRFGV